MNTLLKTLGLIFSLSSAVLLFAAEAADWESSDENVQAVTLGYKNSFLTENHYFFQYNPRLLDHGGKKLQSAIDRFYQTLPVAERFLQNNDAIEVPIYFSTWLTLYRNMPRLKGKEDVIDRRSPVYALALLAGGELDEAFVRAHFILAETPDDYGAQLLLGVLSIRNKEDFPYLERAFLANPYKALCFFDWHLSTVAIEPQEEWDFAHAYFTMLMKHRDLLRESVFPPHVAIRILVGILSKYQYANEPFPDYPSFQAEMEELVDILGANIQPRMISPSNPEITVPL